MKHQQTVLAVILILVFGLFAVHGTSSAVVKKEKTGYLGVGIKNVSSTIKKQLGISGGVIVTWVEEESPADKAGIEGDDIILEVNGTTIKKATTLSRTIRRIAPGEKADITYLREGKKKKVNATIAQAKMQKEQHNCFTMFQDEDGHQVINMLHGPYMGVELQDLNDELAPYFNVKPKEGVLVVAVKDESPAAEAGVKAGDVIQKVGDEPVTTAEELAEIISEYEVDEEVNIDLIRRDGKHSFKVVLDERDNEDENIFIGSGMPCKKMMRMEIHKGDDDGLHEMRWMNDDFKNKEIKIRKKIKTIANFI